MSSPATPQTPSLPPVSDALGPIPAAPATVPAVQTAMRDFWAHVRLWAVVVAGLALDLWSKHWAFERLGQGGRMEIVPGVLEFHTTLNPGALFGIGAGHTEVFLLASVLALVLVIWMFAQSPPQRWLTHVALGAILAGALGNMYDRAFVQLVEYRFPTPAGLAVRWYVPARSADGEWVYLHEFPPRADRAPRTLPGSAWERLGPPRGYVRDFIKIPTRWLGSRELWPWVFNTADTLLVGGVAVLALRLLRERKPAAQAAPRPQLDAGGGRN